MDRRLSYREIKEIAREVTKEVEKNKELDRRFSPSPLGSDYIRIGGGIDRAFDTAGVPEWD